MSEENTEVSTEHQETGATQDYIENLDKIKFVPQEPETEDPVVPEQQQEYPNAQQAEKNADGTPTDTTGTPPETTPETFDFMSTNESGEKVFDEQAAIEFATTSSTQGVKEPVHEPPALIANDPAKTDEPIRTYEENMTGNVMAGLEYFQKFKDMGHDDVMAMHYAKAAVDRDLQNHFNDRKFNSLEDKFTQREKSIDEKEDLAKLTPLSAQNINHVVSNGNWGTVERLQSALFDKNIGGHFLTWIYKVVNPDKTFTSKDEYGKELDTFYKRLTSTLEGAEHLAEFSKAKIFMKNKDQMMGVARKQKEKVDIQNKGATQQSVDNKQTKASQAAPSDKQGLNAWMNTAG